MFDDEYIENLEVTLITIKDTIIRQRAEIERLTIEKDNLIRNYRQCMTEVVKEFAERLSLDIQRHLMPNVDDDGTVTVEIAERYFLKRIKQMTEE